MSAKSVVSWWSASWVARACKYGDPSVDVRDTNPGTVAKPTKTSCLLGKEIPQGAAGLFALDICVVKLFSFPLHASMKKSFGLPTKSWTSDLCYQALYVPSFVSIPVKQKIVSSSMTDYQEQKTV